MLQSQFRICTSMLCRGSTYLGFDYQISPRHDPCFLSVITTLMGLQNSDLPETYDMGIPYSARLCLLVCQHHIHQFYQRDKCRWTASLSARLTYRDMTKTYPNSFRPHSLTEDSVVEYFIHWLLTYFFGPKCQINIFKPQTG